MHQRLVRNSTPKHVREYNSMIILPQLPVGHIEHLPSFLLSRYYCTFHLPLSGQMKYTLIYMIHLKMKVKINNTLS